MAISAGMTWEVRVTGNDANGGGFRGGSNQAAPAQPTVTATAGGAVTANTYYVVVTFAESQNSSSAALESPKSAERSVTTAGGNLTITVTAPANPYAHGYCAYNVYTGTTSGGPYFLNNSNQACGTNTAITATPATSGTQAPGVNYSIQDSPQVTINNSTITATTPGANSNTLTFTGGYTPTAADVGNTVNMSAGTNINTGIYEITGWTSTTWTVTGAQNLTTAGGAGSALQGKMGGGVATIGKANGVLINANYLFLKYNATAYNGNISTAAGAFIGYDTTRTINNTDANRPTIIATANSQTILTCTQASCLLAQVIVDSHTQTGCTGITMNGNPQTVRNCKAGGATALSKGFLSNSGPTLYIGCESDGATSRCYDLEADGYLLFACTANPGSAGVGFFLSAKGSCVDCIAYGMAGGGFGFQGGSHSYCVNCLAYGTSTGSGNLGFTITASGPSGAYINCRAENFSGTSGQGFAFSTPSNTGHDCAYYCSTYNNTADFNTATTQTVYATQLYSCQFNSVDPSTSAGGNNFILNSTTNGGALLRSAGAPASYVGTSTNSFPDIGPTQSAAQTPGAPFSRLQLGH